MIAEPTEPTGFGLSLTNARAVLSSIWEALSQASRTTAEGENHSLPHFCFFECLGVLHRKISYPPSDSRCFERIFQVG